MKQTISCIPIVLVALILLSFNAFQVTEVGCPPIKAANVCGPYFYLESFTSLRRIILKGPQGQEIYDYPANNFVFPNTYIIGEYKFYAISNLPTLNVSVTVVDVTNGTIVASASGAGGANVTFNAYCNSYKIRISGF